MKSLHIFLFILVVCRLSVSGQNTSQTAEEQQVTNEHYIFSVDELPKTDWASQNSAHPFVPQNWLAQYQTEELRIKRMRQGEMRQSDSAYLQSLVDSMAKYVPESFAYHYASYVSSHYSPDAYHHLQAAQRLRPGDPLVNSQLLNHAQVVGDEELLHNASLNLAKSHVYSEARMEYHYNLLQSLPHGAILLTNGNGDSHPLLVLQQAQGIRKDVQIILLELLVQPAYQRRIEAMLGLDSGALDKPRDQQVQTILKKASPVYLSLTLPPSILRDEARDSYLTGLAMRYAPGYTGNNIAELASHWENDWHKEHLLDSDPITRNYLLPLLQLYRYYRTYAPQKATEIDPLIRSLAERTSDPKLIYEQMEK